MKSISRFCGWWGRSSTKSCVLGKIFNFGGSVVIGRGSGFPTTTPTHSPVVVGISEIDPLCEIEPLFS